MKVGSLFTGIMGFDSGFEQEGFEIAWQVENDKWCNSLLEKKRGNVKRFGDIRDFLATAVASPDKIQTADVIVGGDPCPTRSLARGNRQSKHPDLAGYFLAVVGRLQPRWVVRENVPSPDVIHFAVALEAIGYRVVAFALDARDFTSQSRRRQFLVGCPGERATAFRRALFDAADGFGFSSSHAEETAPIAARTTSHQRRLAAEDSYVYEAEPVARCLGRKDGSIGRGNSKNKKDYFYDGERLRVLTPEECEGLQGFPRGWTAGFSRSRRRAMLGNAVCVPVARWIAARIKEAEARKESLK